MISEPDFTSRVEKLIAAGIDPRIAGTRAILDHGCEKGNITEEEKDVAITTLQSFLSAHPGFSFLSPREKYVSPVEMVRSIEGEKRNQEMNCGQQSSRYWIGRNDGSLQG